MPRNSTREPGRRPHACPECSYHSDRRFDVNRHFNLVHKEPRRDHDRSPGRGHSEKRRSASPKRRVESSVTRVSRAETPKNPEQQRRCDSPLSVSPAPDSLLEADAEGPAMLTEISAGSVITDAKDEARKKGLTTRQERESTGKHYRRIVETVVYPDGRVYRKEVEEWD